MAWAQYDPITQARVNRQRALNAAANSADPVTRCAAKEQMFYNGMNELAGGLVQQAKVNGKIRDQLERDYERNVERQIMEKYKPLHR